MPTLFQHKKRQATQLVDMSQVKTPDVVNRLKHGYEALMGKFGAPTMETPETSAISFYLGNAAIARFHEHYGQFGPLPDGANNIVNDYYDMLTVEGVRMFYYLLLICTRETRHVSKSPGMKAQVEHYGAWNFLTKLPKDSDAAAEALKDNPPDVLLGDYTNHMVEVFDDGIFGGGYGGKPWARVATCLREFVHGRTTAEMMLDTAFTLAHNNGPIFNKGMVFHQHSDGLIQILDVQRAGMIPQFLKEVNAKYVKSRHTELHQHVQELCGGFDGVVDWDKVVELGAVGNYNKKKKKANPLPEGYEPPKPAPSKPKKMIVITPKLQIEKISRAEIPKHG
jgi:hypothetical protein